MEPTGVVIGTSLVIFIFALSMKISELRNRSSPKNYCSELTYKRKINWNITAVMRQIGGVEMPEYTVTVKEIFTAEIEAEDYFDLESKVEMYALHDKLCFKEREFEIDDVIEGE